MRQGGSEISERVTSLDWDISSEKNDIQAKWLDPVKRTRITKREQPKCNYD